jgi:hypothetical protein
MRQSPAASRQGRSEAGLSVHGPSPPAQQPVRAEPAITSPAICSAHDAQLTVSRAQPVGGYDTRSCRIEDHQFIPAMVMEGRAERRIGATANDKARTLKYAQNIYSRVRINTSKMPEA